MKTPRRYARFWQPAAGDDYPSQAVVVDCDATEETVSKSPLVHVERLARWSAFLWRATAGRTTRTREAFGITKEEFWYRLDQLLGGNTVTWMFCTPASRILALLGFWELLESKEIVPSGGNNRDRHRDGRGLPGVRLSRGEGDSVEEASHVSQVPQLPGDGGLPDSGKRGAAEGVDTEGGFGGIILADPPVMAFVKRAGRPGLLKVIDTANYGPSPQAWGRPAAERCAAQAKWLQGVVKLLRDNRLGGLRCTAGGQAVYSFRRRLMPVAPYVHTFASLLSLERAAYHGGRCECFRVGKVGGPLYHLDVRSLYPWCGWRHELPITPENIYEGEEAVAKRSLILSSMCVADVTIDTNRPDYPVVAVLSADSPPRPVPQPGGNNNGLGHGKVIYPVGRFRTSLYGPELRDALIADRVFAVHRLATYHGGDFLAPFYATWYGLLERARLDKDEPTQVWIKRVMVSLVGRFGESGKRWVDSAPDPEHGPYKSWQEVDKDGNKTRYRNIAWHTQREEVYPETADSVPSVAGYITSLGRLKLLYLLRIAGYDHTHYCDTDSLICDRHGYESLVACGEIRDNECGYLRLVGSHGRGVFYGVKHYELDGMLKCAGLPRGNAEGSTVEGQAWWRQNLGDAVVSGRRPDARKVLLSYARSGGYKHGVVQRDGRVVPHMMDEET